MDRVLILVRHGQSQWNQQNLFTGWKNPDLTELGEEQARSAAKQLSELRIEPDMAFTSVLKRADHTLQIILRALAMTQIPVTRSQALNERDYGDLTGMNKNEARKRYGEKKVALWRRSFDGVPPGGESLKMTADRVLPFYRTEILPHVLEGRNVIIAAHGNSLRALLMDIERLSADDIIKREFETGVPLVFRLSEDAEIVFKY